MLTGERLVKLGRVELEKQCAEMLPVQHREWSSKLKLLIERNNVMMLEN